MNATHPRISEGGAGVSRALEDRSVWSPSGVTLYPALNDRTNGVVLGNYTQGNQAVNGQFDEFETWNRPLTSAEIARSFQTVQATDTDLNGIADLLEDQSLASPAPFLGRPFLVTGTIEAEQFDRGGRGTSYWNVASHTWTNDYRASGMDHQLQRSGRGLLRGQARVQRLAPLHNRRARGPDLRRRGARGGPGTGGVFRIDFSTNGVLYTNTGNLTVTSTNWTNITSSMLMLQPGTNGMRLVMTNNSVSGFVGKFNYLSIYPKWNESFALAATNDVTVFGAWSTNTDWLSASNNAAILQAAIDDLGTQGGQVTIPAGRFYLAQRLPDDSKEVEFNTAVFLYRNNIEIQGAGKGATPLVAHNRATTLLFLGKDPDYTSYAITNYRLSSITLEGRPHFVAKTNSQSGGFDLQWEQGALRLSDPGNYSTGTLLFGIGKNATNLGNNILITNCLFKHPTFDAVVMYKTISYCLVHGCDFVFRDGTNGTYPFPRIVTDPSGQVGFYTRDGGTYNIVLTENTFTGNPSLVSANTNYFVDAADGIFLGQSGGNWWVAHNVISNYGLEGIHFAAGPSAAADNEFHTLVSLLATCALNAYGGTLVTATGSTNEYHYSFVGNNVTGGRHGELGVYHNVNNRPCTIHVCGNAVSAFPAFNLQEDYPVALVAGRWFEFLNASGNTLASGGHGVWWLTGSTNSIVLKNDFAGATHRAVAYDGDPGSIGRISVLKNTLAQGSSYHLKLRQPDSFGFFLQRNTYRHGSTTTNATLDAASSAVHLVP